MNMKKMPEIDIENSIHRFVQCDDEAFGEIYEFYFPKIESYIKNRFGFRNESEDLASETLIRIHEAKRKGAFKYRDVKQFGGFLFTIAYRSTLNWIRSIELEVPFESVADDDSEKDQSSEQQIPSTDIDASLNAEYNNELNFLYNQLDIILLGYEENKLKSLAAKLFFEDKCSDDIILRTIKRFNNNIKIQDIKEWLKEKTTLRKIVYDKLYCKREDLMNDLFTFAIEELYTNDQESRILQHYYIECKSVEEIAEDEKLAIEKIQWIIQKLCKTPEEEKILRLHYQFGLPIKRAHDSGVGRGIYIFEYKDINMSADEIYEVINKIDLNKMLTCIMNKVINELTECGLNLDKLKSYLKNNGLWERLTFQYFYVDQRTQMQTWKMLKEPAKVVNKEIKEITINNWTSAGRIIKKLIKHLVKHHHNRIDKFKNLFDDQFGLNEINNLTKKVKSKEIKFEKEILKDYYHSLKNYNDIARERYCTKKEVENIINKYEDIIIDILVKKIKKDLR